MEIPKGLTEVSSSSSVRTRNKQANADEQGSGRRAPEKRETGRDEALAAPVPEPTASRLPPGTSDLSYTLRNAFEGIALLEIAVDALGRILDTLQQAREITAASLQPNIDSNAYPRLHRQLRQHLDTMEGIALTTRYKGVRILQGGLGCACFQVDLNSGRIVAINLDSSMRRSALGAISTVTSGPLRLLFGEERNASPPVLSAASMRGTESTGSSANTTGEGGKLILEPGDFTLKVGDDEAVGISGSFSHLDALVHAINEQADNLSALADQQNATLTLSAFAPISVSGEKACSPQWLGFDSHVRQPAGNLSSVSLLDKAGRIEALQRIDAGITQVASVRIRFEESKRHLHEAMNEMQLRGRGQQPVRPKVIDPVELIASLKRSREQLAQQQETSIQVQANVDPHTVNALLSPEFQERPLTFCELHCEKGKERCI